MNNNQYIFPRLWTIKLPEDTNTRIKIGLILCTYNYKVDMKILVNKGFVWIRSLHSVEGINGGNTHFHNSGITKEDFIRAEYSYLKVEDILEL